MSYPINIVRRGVDLPVVDSGEVVHISALALLKMLKHGRAGVPIEVVRCSVNPTYFSTLDTNLK